MGIKSWSNRYTLSLSTGTVVKVFRFERWKRNIKITKDKYNIYCIEVELWDILAEEFYPPYGIGESIKEAFLNFQLQAKSKRKRFKR